MSSALENMSRFYENFDVDMCQESLDTCTSCYLSLKEKGKLCFLKNLRYFDPEHTKNLFLNIIELELKTEIKNETLPDEKTEQIISDVSGFLTQSIIGTRIGSPDLTDSFCKNFRILQEKGYLFYIHVFFSALVDSEEDKTEAMHLASELVTRELSDIQ